MTKEFSEFKDRRKFVRVSIYVITRYFCPFRDREVGVQARISDISEGGALLVTFEEGIPQEVSVEMSFVLPGGGSQFVSVEGKVKHTGLFEKELYRSGIEFIKLNKKDQLSIREYIAAQKKK